MPSWVVRCLADCALQPRRKSVSTKVAAASVAPHHGRLRRLSLAKEPRSAACVVSRSGVPSQTPVAQAKMTCRRCRKAGSMFLPPAAWAFASIVVAAFCPRLSRYVALAASTLMDWSCVGVSTRTSEPQITPAFEPVRVSLPVCAPALRSCLTRLVRFDALAKPPLDDERPPPPAQL